MSKDHTQPTDISRIEDEAIGWVQKIASEAATPVEIEAAQRWRDANPLHAKAYDDAERVWNRMGDVGRAQHGHDIDFTRVLRDFGQHQAAINRRRMLLGGGVAMVGAAAIYSVAKPPLGLWPSFSELRADYRTGTGEQRTIRLTDTVAIDLNTQTSLAIRSATADEDCVELIGGEASFTAQSRSSRSLAVVAANGKTVSEVGRFDVRYIANSDRFPVSVICFNGRLRIELGKEVVHAVRKFDHRRSRTQRHDLRQPPDHRRWQHHRTGRQYPHHQQQMDGAALVHRSGRQQDAVLRNAMSGECDVALLAAAAAQQSGAPKQGSGNAQPSIIIVEVLGFGGGSGEEKPDSEQQRNRGKQSRLNYDSDSTVRVLGNGPISSEQMNVLTTEENELLAAGERHRVVSVR